MKNNTKPNELVGEKNKTLLPLLEKNPVLFYVVPFLSPLSKTRLAATSARLCEAGAEGAFSSVGTSCGFPSGCRPGR